MILQHTITVFAAMGILMLAIFTAIDASADARPMPVAHNADFAISVR